MIKYALMKVGAGENDLSRYVFYNTVKFNVGGDVFSFHDFESGLLRGNRKVPYALNVQFDKKDPRLKLAVKNVDCRLHFGLNCGVRSCPPVNRYSVDNLDEELAMAAHSFCEDDDNVFVDPEKMELHLSRIFAWYKIDFARNNKGLPDAVLPYLRRTKQQELDRMIYSGGKIRVIFKPYDWGSVAKNVKTFDSSELKMDGRSIKGALRPQKQSTPDKAVHRFSSDCADLSSDTIMCPSNFN